MSKTKKRADFHEEVNGQITFFGVFCKYYDEIAAGWNAKTRSSYDQYYDQLIFPRLNDIPLEDCTKETFSDLIDAIAEERALGSNPYSDSTLDKFRSLCRAVTKAAYNHRICDDVLWGTAFVRNEVFGKGPTEQAARTGAKIRRSLSESEERTLFRRLFEAPFECGEYLGLAIMDALGTRPQEACGLNYGNIVARDAAGQTFYVLQIIATTKRNANELKTGGKTKNAPRLLPMPDRLAELLLNRKRALQEMIANGQLEEVGEGKAFQSVKDLPIVCKGEAHTQRCSANDLCRKGKALLHDIKLNESILDEISNHIRSVFVGENMQEKDETSYLLRRNFATKMSQLGATTAEMHYLMGHDMSEDGVGATKSGMTNPDQLLRMKNLLEQRNFIGSAVKQKLEQIIVNLDDDLIREGDSSVPCEIKLHTSTRRRVTIVLEAKEPESGTLTFTKKARGSVCSGTIYTSMHAVSQRSDALAIGTYIRAGERSKTIRLASDPREEADSHLLGY